MSVSKGLVLQSSSFHSPGVAHPAAHFLLRRLRGPSVPRFAFHLMLPFQFSCTSCWLLAGYLCLSQRIYRRAEALVLSNFSLPTLPKKKIMPVYEGDS